MKTTFQPPSERGTRLFVPAPRIDCLPGGDSRYSFQVWIRRRNGRSLLLQEVAFTSSEKIVLSGMDGTPALTAALLPAMRLGLALEIEAPVSARVLDRAAEFQDVFSTWMDAFQRVEILAPKGGLPIPSPGVDRGLASFFSGGVDGFHTLQRHFEEVSHLVYIHGFDVEGERIAHRMAVENDVARVTSDLGRELIVIQTNVRTFSDAYICWREYCGSVLGACAQLLHGTAHTVLVGASNTYADYRPFGTNPLTDPFFSTEGIEVVHDGADADRVEKVEALARWDVAMRHLRVCWSMHGTTMNCGRCEKCMRTMTALFLVGALHRAPTFPGALEPATVARVRLKPWDFAHVRHGLDAARERGLEDTPLMRAWRDCLAGASVRLLAGRSSGRDDLQREIPRALGRWVRRPSRWFSDLRRPDGREIRVVWNAIRSRRGKP